MILRGFTLKGAGSATNTSARPIGAILIEGGENIVIEDCDISNWGRVNPKTGFGQDYDSAIFSRSPILKRLIVQRCKLHHPRFDGSTWHEPTYPTHTMGPQCITLFNTAGNHVIRYNECWSDLDHMYNDIIGGGSNGAAIMALFTKQQSAQLNQLQRRHSAPAHTVLRAKIVLQAAQDSPWQLIATRLEFASIRFPSG